MNAVSATDAKEYRHAAIALLLLVGVPFTQFGLTFWISVQGLSFVLVALFVRKDISRLQMVFFIAIAVTMLASLAGHLYADTLAYAFLRLIRQILSFYLIVCAAATVSWKPKDYFFDVVLPIVVIGLSGLVILQYLTYTLKGWTFLFVPSKFFIRGFSTLADKWIEFGAERGFLASIRAAGTYSEPSYFGFVALSLAMVVIRGVRERFWVFVLLTFLLVALLCSKSASGVVLFLLLVLFAFRKRVSPLALLAAVLFIVISLTGASLFLDFHLFDRLLNITNPVLEPSGYTRLVLPFKHIALVLQYQPLGVPLSEFFTFTSRHMDSYAGSIMGGPVSLLTGVSNGIDNGFLNLFVSLGFGGFIVVGLLPFIIKDRLTLLYLLFVCQFNGDIFSPDKAAMIALVVSCGRAAAGAATAAAKPKPKFTPADPFGAMFPTRA